MNSDRQSIPEEEVLHAIALVSVPGIGPVLARKLVSRFGSAVHVFRKGPAALRRLPGIGPVLSSAIQDKAVLAAAEKVLAIYRRQRIDILLYCDPRYPRRLAGCPDAPFLLYSRGTCSWEDRKVVSVVGSRQCTEYGRRLTADLVRSLSGKGIVIVSGLARGIDAEAHRGAMRHGIATAAVLAHGPDMIYPAAHRPLARDILEADGMLLTEYPWGKKPDRMYFPARNRIIAGLADAVVVVESAERGGALITADIADSYHRDVFTFPGRVGDRMSSGCLELVRRHRAVLVRSGEDLLFEMGWRDIDSARQQIRRPVPPAGLTALEELIFSRIYSGPGPVNLDEILELRPSDAEAVRSGLLRLELEGCIRSAPGNSFVKA